LQEQSKSDAEKLIADVTNLVSNHIRRQKELVCFLCVCTQFL
jgi:kinesin family protein 11